MNNPARPTAPMILALALSACGGGSSGDGGHDFTNASVAVGDQPKELAFTWRSEGDPVAAYRLEVNPDGASGFSGVDVNGDGTVNEDDELADSASAVDVTIPLHATDFLNARYQVVALADDGSEVDRSDTLFLDDLTTEGLIGYFKASNTDNGDGFGNSIAIDSDGDTVAVGAATEDSIATGIGGDATDDTASQAGAVYVFARGADGTWAQQAYVKASNTDAGDNFGASVALAGNGDTLAIGARDEASDAAGINGNETNNNAAGAGAVYVFQRASDATWSQQAYVKASNTDAGDNFGATLALAGNGDTLAVGADLEDSVSTGVNGDESNNDASASGATYVFVRDDDAAWSQQAYVKASNTDTGDFFGKSVALSASGNTLVVGAIGEASGATGVNGDETKDTAGNAGAAYVFARSINDVWSQQAYVKASNTGDQDEFGTSVALTGDGDKLAVGAPDEESDATGINGDDTNDNADNSGAAYVFERADNGTWSQQVYVKASNTDSGDEFGTSLALSGDGDTLAVGATEEDSDGIGVDGNNSNFSSSFNAGAAYVYERPSDGSWSQQAYVKASNTDGGDRFGSSLALSGDSDTLGVGAISEDSAASGIDGDDTDNTTSAAGAAFWY